MSIFSQLQETAPFLFGGKKKPSHQQVLALRPMRHPGATWARKGEDNLVVLSIRRRDDRWANLLSGVFGIPAAREIELTDELSSRVWEMCDGKHTVGEIARILAADYKLGTRQAEVSVFAFLRTLQTKRLVGIPADQAKTVRAAIADAPGRAPSRGATLQTEGGYYARRKQRSGRPNANPTIGKTKLPFSVVFKISMNGMKIRFARSIVTASGIFLSIAFFAYVQTNLQLSPHLTTDERARQTWLAIMALLVCLVGITNSMLMSVTERFREIGTMKCLGAPNGFLVGLFFVEAVFMGLAASIPGAMLGILGGLILLATQGLWPPNGLSVLAVFFESIALGAAITFMAAYFPSQQASKMPAAAALRTDV